MGNQDAIDRHHETDMMKEIIALREKYDLHMKVDKFIRQNDGAMIMPKSILENNVRNNYK